MLSSKHRSERRQADGKPPPGPSQVEGNRANLDNEANW